MDKRAVQLDRETFSCPICLDLLTDPVAIPCGHSYCLGCIKKHWEEDEKKGSCSCPQCRKVFRPRPELLRNTMLAAVVERLKKSGVQAAPADHFYAGPEDVACDVCTGRKLKAVKSCLVCVASFCDAHLQPHRAAFPLKMHELVEPFKNPGDYICPSHDQVTTMFCRSCQQCFCLVLCCVEEHAGHDVVTVEAERREKQAELRGARRTIRRRIQGRESDLKTLQQEAAHIGMAANRAVAHSRGVYAKVIRLVEKRTANVRRQIGGHRRAEIRRVKELQEKLEREIAELRGEEISLTDERDCFLVNDPDSRQGTGSPHTPAAARPRPRRCFGGVRLSLARNTKTIQDFVKSPEWAAIPPTHVDALLAPEPGTRAEFLKCARHVTLDPKTSHLELTLSQGNRTATRTPQGDRHDHPDKFRSFGQVLSKKSLSGRCYWEVDIKAGAVHVAVAYKDIRRDGAESKFGHNDRSWALYCFDETYEFRSGGVSCPVSGPWSSKVGVYLDHSAGLLCFYSVSGDTMTLLHRVQTTFTEPLHAGLWLCWDGSSAEFLKLT